MSAGDPSDAARPSTLRALVLAARPRTLPAAAAPVVVGSAVAHALGAFAPLPALAALVGALLIQIGTNYVNDVLDFERGTDTAERVGPQRMTQAGILAPRQVKLAAAGAFGLAALAGVYLVAIAGWPILAVGVASILSGVAYTGGPFPLAYNGLGDIFVMLFFGVVAVCGTVFVQAGHVPELAVWASLPVGALATAILVVNNVRDIETDTKSGRRTLPVVFGRVFGVVEYALLLAVAMLVPVLMVVAKLASPWLLLVVGTLPSGLRLLGALRRDRGPALNATLAGTAQLLLLHALVFAAAIAFAPPVR